MFFETKVLGARLEEMLNEDKQLEGSIAAMMNDETKQKELLLQDEEEDFLDEGIDFNANNSLYF